MFRRDAQREWFAIALTPLWLVRLLLALALAVVFGLLGQWQLGRALPPQSANKPNAGQILPTNLTRISVIPDQNNIFIISGRLQADGASGFWLVSNSTLSSGSQEQTVAWGWAPNFDDAVSAHQKLAKYFAVAGSTKIAIGGILGDSEAPLPGHPTQPFLFDSLSNAQLVNIYQPVQARKLAEQFFLVLSPSEVTKTAGLSSITINQKSPAPLDNINWLSAFYAIEWSVFAGFAIFMWWRLVEDERLRRKALASQS